MQALILEKAGKLAIRDIAIKQTLGRYDVKIAIRNVGVCGSDVHYYKHGAIGPFVVREPMVLGHEASGIVTAVGDNVTHLQPGDRVCMEPGIPDLKSRATLEGKYNLDPAVSFWATPPIHGCLMPEVVHPANFTFKLPDNVSFAEGALIEPLATGMQAADKARIRPGDVAVVIGAGTIGMLTAIAALAGGCSRVIIADLVQEKLDIAARYDAVTAVNIAHDNLAESVASLTDGWGAQVVFEASGSPKAYANLFDLACPGGCVVLVGMPPQPVTLDIVAMQAKEIRIESVFRYANQFPRALALLGSGKLDIKPMISGVFPFEKGIEAFERAARAEPGDIKVQISFE
ncbi:NAD(P)-dependent alcohol dehydrogenase [Marinobacterium sedimentorum]|uniref:NAD(P)-dependent alcohol dehydrogenase n=1 Tax=Marinobacterium sedimentorum TaxID=2927804 RepID=UPI0020C6E59E|nr:NAD(P)-dependent alcohol dehydrogenase [Marinobacterium sedimentorum]MCP8686210.1 NAD(P)-dependent alcohol dehydrogenase [Marinobacterium sedimentorum]